MTITELAAHRNDTNQSEPYDHDAERAALGAAIADARALRRLAEILNPTDLHHPAHQTVYETALEMHDSGRPLGPVAVNAELARRGHTRATGGAAYILQLTDDAPTAPTAGHYARIIADLALKRRIAQAATRITQTALAAEGDADELADHATTLIEQAATSTTRTDGDTTRLGDDRDFLDRLAEPLNTHGLVATPYSDLTDALTGGFKPGELVCVAGRTGVGKSVVGLDTARHAAIRNGQSVLYVSLEMPADLLRERIYAAEAKVPLHGIKEHKVAESDWSRLAAARPRIADAPLYISTPDTCTLAVLRQRLAALERRGTPSQLLVVDHVGLMSSSARVESRYTEVSAYSRGLKQIAMALHIPVLMLCQVKRDPSGRSDTVPRLSDLRDSGELEQSSDVVVMVHRPDHDVADKESPRAGEADLYIAKNRSGATGAVTVSSQLHYARLADMARGREG